MIDRAHVQNTLLTAAQVAPHPAYNLLAAYVAGAFGVHTIDRRNLGRELALLEEMCPGWRAALDPLRHAWGIPRPAAYLPAGMLWADAVTKPRNMAALDWQAEMMRREEAR